MTHPSPTRVVIVDDSALMRRALTELLASDPLISVVGTASNGQEAIAMVESHRPQVVVMDVWMPVMDGLAATEYLMAYCPTPILVLTGAPTHDEHNIMFRMLGAGALDVLEKPGGGDMQALAMNGVALCERIKTLARVRVVTHLRGRRHSHRELPPMPVHAAEPGCVVIGASTGGPRAIAHILGALPATLPVPVVVVQHIARGFAPGLAEWLGGQTALRTVLAGEGTPLRPGNVYIVPDQYDLRLNDQCQVTLSPSSGVSQPSIDVTMRSIAQTLGSGAIGVLLTGMGRDGAAGLASLREAGAHTIAQDAATSAIFGMPRAAIECGAAREVLPLDAIAARLLALIADRQGVSVRR